VVRRVRPPRLQALYSLAFVVGGWCAGLVQLSDNSFLWHLRTGHLILGSGIPRSDPYSFTVPGAKWVAQSWMAEVLYAVLDDLAGPWGIRLLSAACGAVVGGAVYKIALRFARNRLRAGLLAILALSSLMTIWAERPLVFGILGVVLLLWTVEVPDSWPARHVRVVVPAGIWILANLHGSWILAVGFVGLHVVGRWMEGAPPWAGTERALVVATTAGVAIVALNPYGVDLIAFPIRLVLRGETLDRVIEWSSPDFRSQAGMIFGAWIVCFLGCAALGRRRPGVRDIVVAAPFLLLALWALRNIAVATIVMLPVAARAIATDSDRHDDRSGVGWVLGALLIGLAGTWTVHAAGEEDYDSRFYPVAAMRSIDESGDLGRRLFTTDAWAGYVIAEYWPEQRVFMDDRYDMYPQELATDYANIAELRPSWDRLLDRYGVEVIVWPRTRGLTQALDAIGSWKEVHRDDVAVVFSRILQESGARAGARSVAERRASILPKGRAHDRGGRSRETCRPRDQRIVVR